MSTMKGQMPATVAKVRDPSSSASRARSRAASEHVPAAAGRRAHATNSRGMRTDAVLMVDPASRGLEGATGRALEADADLLENIQGAARR